MPALHFLGDPLFWIAAVAAFAGALIRGFSGFGSGLVFMPIGAACLGPPVAAGVLYIIDTLLILPFVFRAVPLADWREVLPVGIGAALVAPLGVAALIALDPTLVRWGVSLAILSGVALLWAGVRYRGPARLWLSLIVGAIAGFLSGLAQIPGPPVLLYMLGRDATPAYMRANTIVVFMFATVVTGIFYVARGIFTDEVLLRAAALLPVYAVGMFLGSRMFGWASPATYRSIAYASIVFAAVIALPVFG